MESSLPAVNGVRFKRDLRLLDHAPLAEACRRPQVKQESARILALHVRPDRGRSRRGAQEA